MASNDKVRVAFIGAGSLASRVHYPSLAAMEDVELVAACDINPEALARVADRYSIPGRYQDYRKMIREVAPDAVFAIGQPQEMYDIWCWCLAQGLPLYIEKPMGITLHQAEVLAHLAERHGCITQVGFQRRSHPLVVRLQQACQAKGPLYLVVCRFYKHGPEPFLLQRDRMMDDGIHVVDTLRALCGGEPVAVDSVAARIGTPDINLLTAHIRFSTGAVGVMLCSWASGRRIFAVEMHAPGIAAEVEPEVGGRLLQDGDTEGVYYPSRDACGGEELFLTGGFRAKHREFIAAVLGKGQTSSPFADAVRSMELAERILAKGRFG